MGRLSGGRYWDGVSFTSREATGDDSPDDIFRAFIPHPIADWDIELDSECLERVMVAEDAVRRLERNCGGDAALPAEWLVRRAESAASSTIEGVYPSARRLARAEAQLGLFGEQPRPNDIEALRNVAAFEHALEIAAHDRPLAIEDVVSVHRTLMGESDPGTGQIRTRQNWIGPGQLWSTPLNASYIPPPPENVPKLMEDLLERVNREEGHPLVEMAVVHAQFEMIHPFGDGNGRTGRALMQMMLQRSRLALPCTLPVSSALAIRKDNYIASLGESSIVAPPDDPARSRAVRKWIAIAADAVAEAAAYAEFLIGQVAGIKRNWEQQVAVQGYGRTAARRLLAHLAANPILNAEKAAELLGASWRTGARSLEQLQDAGVLVQRSAGRRNRVYEAEAITDAFAAVTRSSPVLFEQAGPGAQTQD